MYNAKGQSGTGVGGTDGLGTIRCNLFVNDIDRGEVNNGPATQFNTLPIIFDPNHPQFEEDNVLDQFYTANQLSNHGLQNTFKEGDLIKIRIDTNVNIEQAMCSLVWEYDYFI